MLAHYFSNFSSPKVTCHLTSALSQEPNQSFLSSLADIEMLFQSSSLCSSLSGMEEKMEKMERPGFPNDGSGGVFGVCV